MRGIGELRVATIGACHHPARSFDRRHRGERVPPVGLRAEQPPFERAVIRQMLFVEAVLAQRRSARPIGCGDVQQPSRSRDPVDRGPPACARRGDQRGGGGIAVGDGADAQAVRPGRQQRQRSARRADARGFGDRRAAERPIASRYAQQPCPGRPERHQRQREHRCAIVRHDDRARMAAIGRDRRGEPLIAKKPVRRRRRRRDPIDRRGQPIDHRRAHPCGEMGKIVEEQRLGHRRPPR